MADRTVSVRLTAEGHEALIRALKASGDEGERMAKRLEKAGREPTAAMLALNDVAAAGRERLDDLAERAGVAGGALRNFGLAGTALAAGLGGALAAVGALTAGTVAAARAADELDDTAARIGVGVEALQELRFAAAEFGSSAEEMDDALQKLTRRIGDAAAGEQEAVKAFAAIGVAVRTSGGQVRSTEDVFADVADRIADLPTEAERASAAMNVFGRTGERLGAVLANNAGQFAEVRQRARDLGIVVDAELIKRGADASRQLEILGDVLRGNLTSAFLSFAPAVNQVATALAAVVARLGEVSQGLVAIENRTTVRLQTDLADVDGRLAAATAQVTAAESSQGRQSVGTRNPERIRRGTIRAGAAANSEADLRAALAVAEAEGDTEWADAIREQLGIDSGGDLTVLRGRRDALQAERDRIQSEIERRNRPAGGGAAPPAGGVTAPAASRPGLPGFIADLEGRAADSRAALSGGPLAQEIGAATRAAEAKALEDYNKQLRATADLTDDERQAVAVAVVTRIENVAAMREQQELEREGERVTQQYATATEKHAERMADLNRLRDAGAISEDTYTRAVKDATEELTRQTSLFGDLRSLGQDAFQTIGTAAEDAILAGKGMRDVLQGVLSDLGRIAVRASVTKPLESAGGGLLSGIGDFVGSWWSGGGTATAGGGGAALVAHTGGIVGVDPLPTRRVDPRVFARAPRYHMGGVAGLRPNEVPAILEKGELIISKGQQAGLGAVSVTVIDQRTASSSSPVEVSRGSDGRELQIYIRDQVASAVASGAADDAMRRRFGLNSTAGAVRR